MSDTPEQPRRRPKPDGGIRLKGLNITAASRPLLVDVDAEFLAGQITLIVGPSGVGKSLLLKLIAGILESNESAIKHSGEIAINGRKATAGQVGIVFQSFALFDELSAKSNIEYAKASGGSRSGKVTSAELLEKLEVPGNVPTSRLSGGQQQRLAIARTVAFNPPVIVYDEPTSGLDPATGKMVAELISETHEKYGETTLVVTHDYPSLLPIADRVYLLDPVQKALVCVEPKHWEQLPERLESFSRDLRSQDQPLSVGWRDVVQERTKDFLEGTTEFASTLLMGLYSLIPIWRTPRWGMHFVGHYARLVCGPTALIYLIMAGIISGFVTTFFTFKFLPYATYTEPLLIEDLLVGLGFATYRIFVPVLSCVLIAARCGAAITSDVGGRQFGNQIDAMKSFQTTPRAYLLTPILWSFLIGTPILCLAAYVAASTTSLITFVQNYPERGPDFWYQHFHRGLIVVGQNLYRGTGWLMAKLLLSGFGIALIAYFNGRRPKFSTSDVSRSITTTILVATLYVLLVHFFFSFYEYEGIVPGATVPTVDVVQ